jgi:hypothetical protein
VVVKAEVLRATFRDIRVYSSRGERAYMRSRMHVHVRLNACILPTCNVHHHTDVSRGVRCICVYGYALCVIQLDTSNAFSCFAHLV